MKKLTAILLTTILLCGCAEGKSKETNPEPVTFDAASYENEEECIDVATAIEYESLDDLKASQFISDMKLEGYTPYYLEYDEELYTLSSITSDANFYRYRIYDNSEERGICYTVTYDISSKSVQDLDALADNYDKNVITTAQRNGVTYDVYLSTSPYNFVPDNPEPVLDYGLLYIPFPGYKANIFVDGDTTTDEILSYFDDFELVAEE